MASAPARTSSARPKLPLSMSASPRRSWKRIRSSWSSRRPRRPGSARRRRSPTRARRPSRTRARASPPVGVARLVRARRAAMALSNCSIACRGSPRRYATWPRPACAFALTSSSPATSLEHLRVQALGELELAQPERDLGLEVCAVALVRVRPRREIVLGDAEPAAELAKELERRDPVTRLDPRDVGRRAAREGQLPLAEAGGLPRCAKAIAYRLGSSTCVDFCRGI